MTTITTDGKTMAGDGRSMTANDVVGSDASEKVLRLSDGSLLGCAGTAAVKHRLAEWIEACLRGEDRAFPTIKGAFSAMLLLPTGELRYFYEEGRELWTEISAPFAIGSGNELAIGAMLKGAGPAEAIELASTRDPFTGGVVQELELGGTDQ